MNKQAKKINNLKKEKNEVNCNVLGFDHYSLPQFELNDDIEDLETGDYAVAVNYEDVEYACKEYIESSLWAFNPDFLSNYLPLCSESIKLLQESLYESANDDFLKLIGDDETSLRALVQDAISTDGEGHFLSPYDGQIIEIPYQSCGDELKIILEEVFGEISTDSDVYIFRIN